MIECVWLIEGVNMKRKTSLYDLHVEWGGKIVDFAGYLLPVSFQGIVAEHQRVREKVGLFDVSHMGEIEIRGKEAEDFAEYVVTNRVKKYKPGRICYTVACNEEGKVLDDLLVYKFSPERILLVVNAVNSDKIYNHVSGLAGDGLTVLNLTPEIAQIAVQGPQSRELILRSGFFTSVRDRIEGLKYYRFFTFQYNGDEVIFSRTGYTGELGYEIYVPSDLAPGIWKELLDIGGELDVAPIGLGARDTLRFEAGYCLYGNELDEQTSPLETGLSWVVKLKKDSFIGRESLQAEKEEGPKRKICGFELEGRRIARHGFSVLLSGKEIGKVTSGTFAPTMKKSLAMSLISSSAPEHSDDYTIDIRGIPTPAKRVEIPFYQSRSRD
jgi:aminomethyltransferase